MAEFEPRHGEVVEVAEGVARVVAPNPGPFTGAGTNTYLIGDRRLMLVDPGPQHAAHQDALVAALRGRPLTHILVTHTHRDHVDGLAALKAATGATVVGEGPHRDARALKPGEENPFLYAADLAYSPDEVVGDGEVIENGEVAVMAIATPGHTANHLAFAVGDTVFSGDHVMGWSTTVIAPPDGSMAAYMGSLDRLTRHGGARYLPGHGDVVNDPMKAVSAMRSHRLMRERAIFERVTSGDIEVPQIVDALYEGIDPRLKGAAGLSVLAHLEKLEEDGRIASAGHGAASRWSPA